MTTDEYKTMRESRSIYNALKLCPGEMSLMDHAEFWARENGLDVPEDKDSDEYTTMYEKWIDFAFQDLAK